MENQAIKNVKKHFIGERALKVDSEELKREMFYIECNPEISDYLCALKTKIPSPIPNTQNSTVMFVMGITDEMPKDGGISRTPTTLPDIDYDTDGRDAVKEYLVKKYGADHVTLLGTYQTLKTKGAIKDVIRQLRPNMEFEEVNNLTKKFDAIKRTDTEAIAESIKNAQSGRDYSFLGDNYSSEISFFYACIELDPVLRKWFDDNKEVEESVTHLLGNAKATGIHAGGIVVSSVKVPETIPVTYAKDDGLWVTQPEMAYVEESGLVKYDFLGLKTLGDLNLCLQLIKKRHGKEVKIKDIPLDDKAVLDEFRKGNTISVFQFNTSLSVSILTKLKSVSSINDLAIITSIARPGPLKMGMDKNFIARNNGDEEISYLHPKIEPVLNQTYGIVVYQESVMQIVQILGGLSGDESVTVLKAMGKKQKDKLVKFKDKFIKHSIGHHKITPELADNIWQYLEAFAEYGFNRSHAIAYSCVSYLCMWFKENYPAEWRAAVLSNADKEDFKLLYQQWKDDIKPPNINDSKDQYIITEDNKVIMPLGSINGLGTAVVDAIVKGQPYSSFEDFFTRVDKRKVTKSAMINMIFAGCFDILKPDVHYSETKFRKETIRDLLKLREKIKKPSAAERKEQEDFIKEVADMSRGQLMMKEISLLNFTSFDYHEYYHAQMTEGAKKAFGHEALRPHEVTTLPNNKVVVVGGAVQSINFFPIKSGANKGKEMAKIVLSNDGGNCDIVVFPKTLEQSDKSGGKIRKIKEYTPLIVKGKVNHWNGSVSIVYDEGWILI